MMFDMRKKYYLEQKSRGEANFAVHNIIKREKKKDIFINY